jgi:mono/diheme cytochrome c family protein
MQGERSSEPEDALRRGGWRPSAPGNARRRWRRLPLVARLALTVPLALGTATAAWALGDYTLVQQLHPSAFQHAEQSEFKAMVASGRKHEAFEEAFEHGDDMFARSFEGAEGVGANVGQGQRFSRVPRADLAAPGEWASHLPKRTTGPNAQNCTACHAQLFEDAAGPIAGNAIRDPLHTGNIRSFIQRNAPAIFAIGAQQRLAEEMSQSLSDQREAAGAQSCQTGGDVTVQLVAKGISFGALTARRTGTNPCTVSYDTAAVRGVGVDLLVRPFQWKGSVATVRDFNRGAMHNELGMQAVEMAGYGVDGDGDGVKDELTVGDITALTIYAAAQPRPTTRLELADLANRRLLPPLDPPMTPAESAAISRGSQVFQSVGCASCHVPRLTLDDPIFSEPSMSGRYRDAQFPAGMDPIAEGVDPAFPVTFDLTRDQPDNQLKDSVGRVAYRLGSLQRDSQGKAYVELFGDLRRHDMGPGLAEPIADEGVASSVWMTENLWGVASTAPYMHDGRATTLTEAILAHGGEGQAARDAFVSQPLDRQKDLIAFLNNLVLFKIPEED